MNKRLKVCYFGSFDILEPHNSTYLRGLQQVGVEVVECRAHPIKDRDSASRYKNVFQMTVMMLRYMKNNVILFLKSWGIGDIDAVIVGYPGFFDIFLAKVLSKIKRVPLLYNVHISLYETMVLDRKYIKEASLLAKLVKVFDRLTFHISDVVLVDTISHGDYYAKLYGIPRGKFAHVYIGADDLFKPINGSGDGKFTVLFYGTFIPLQGIEYVVEAAHLLKDESDINFEIIGRGQTKEEILRLARELRTTNIRFIDWVSRDKLVEEIAKADICLGGQFGMTEKADLVIGYKCFQMVAMRKPVVLSDSKGNRELFEDGQNCVFCRRADSQSLARAILKLKRDSQLRERISQNAWITFNRACSPKKIGEDLREIVCRSMKFEKNLA